MPWLHGYELRKDSLFPDSIYPIFKEISTQQIIADTPNSNWENFSDKCYSAMNSNLQVMCDFQTWKYMQGQENCEDLISDKYSNCVREKCYPNLGMDLEGEDGCDEFLDAVRGADHIETLCDEKI